MAATCSDVRRLREGEEIPARDIAAAFYRVERINAAFLADERNYLLAAYVDGTLAGFLVAYELPRLERGEPMTYLHRLDVLPKFHRRGVGRALVEKLKALAAKRGSFKMFAVTSKGNEGAMRLYEATGGKRLPEADAVFEYRKEEV